MICIKTIKNITKLAFLLKIFLYCLLTNLSPLDWIFLHLSCQKLEYML